ncbi:MAG: hypothetical protein RBR97_12955 [Bacteroidales bacterium]|jgi:hypothetical protein|nr:hypothetical protein [Bacteroidales bacterium]
MKLHLTTRLTLICLLSTTFIINSSCEDKFEDPNINDITPNHFVGNDNQRIQFAIDSAKNTTNLVVIPKHNSNGSNEWLLDSAILVPSNITIILDNCTIRLSDKCRDNMFRSENVGIGIIEPKWEQNINIIGKGNVKLVGANNPRSTGDAGKTLSHLPQKGESYGTDSGKKGYEQTGDWRNIMVLMAYVDRFRIENIKIINSHAWGISLERVTNASISNINFQNREYITVNKQKVKTLNKDGINLRQGCKNISISDCSGYTGDDFIALTNLMKADNISGNLYSTTVTSSNWFGIEDDIENINIFNINCESKHSGIAIRASDSASIKNIRIDRLDYNGPVNTILIDGKSYGISLPKKINNIGVVNFKGSGKSLVHIAAPISDCSFKYGIYIGEGDIVTYGIEKEKTHNITFEKLSKN